MRPPVVRMFQQIIQLVALTLCIWLHSACLHTYKIDGYVQHA